MINDRSASQMLDATIGGNFSTQKYTKKTCFSLRLSESIQTMHRQAFFAGR